MPSQTQQRSRSKSARPVHRAPQGSTSRTHREGRLSQDTRRKLKQVHLYQFIEPLLNDARSKPQPVLTDHGAGKVVPHSSCTTCFSTWRTTAKTQGHIYGIEPAPDWSLTPRVERRWV
jgi:hypothetical protein